MSATKQNGDHRATLLLDDTTIVFDAITGFVLAMTGRLRPPENSERDPSERPNSRLPTVTARGNRFGGAGCCFA